LKLTLKQLQVFLAVAQHQNTASASRALNLSQSAVSAALNTLEQHYDVQLFDRVGKRLVLNKLGHDLRLEAQQILVSAETLEANLAGFKDYGHIRIGASFTIANHLAINFYTDYLSVFPKARIDLVSGNSPEIIRRLTNFEVDLAMVEAKQDSATVKFEPWVEDELVAFCSATHPLARIGNLSNSDLVEQRWILRERDSGARQWFDRTFKSMLAEMHIYLEFRHNEQIKKAVEAGLGIGCLSEKVLAANFESGSLVPLRLPSDFNLRRQFYLATLHEQYLSPGASHWLSLCAASISRAG